MAYTIVENFDDEDEINNNDRVKEVEFNGRKFIITCKDPYGHWHISLPKGKLPEELSGRYTIVSMAEKACEKYAHNKPLELTYHQKIELEGDTLDPNRGSLFDGEKKRGNRAKSVRNKNTE